MTTKTRLRTLEDLRRIRPGDPEAQARYRAEMEAELRAYKLQEIRKRLGLTQVALAERTEVTQKRISQIEHGRIDRLMVDTLRRYVEGLGGTLRLEVEIDGKVIPLG